MDRDMHLHDETTKLNNYETSQTDTAGWQGYVYDLCRLRDVLKLSYVHDAKHPVLVAPDRVAPSMTPEDESYVRAVISEYHTAAS